MCAVIAWPPKIDWLVFMAISARPVGGYDFTIIEDLVGLPQSWIIEVVEGIQPKFTSPIQPAP